MGLGRPVRMSRRLLECPSHVSTLLDLHGGGSYSSFLWVLNRGLRCRSPVKSRDRSRSRDRGSDRDRYRSRDRSRDRGHRSSRRSRSRSRDRTRRRDSPDYN